MVMKARAQANNKISPRLKGPLGRWRNKDKRNTNHNEAESFYHYFIK